MHLQVRRVDRGVMCAAVCAAAFGLAASAGNPQPINADHDAEAAPSGKELKSVRFACGFRTDRGHSRRVGVLDATSTSGRGRDHRLLRCR